MLVFLFYLFVLSCTPKWIPFDVPERIMQVTNACQRMWMVKPLLSWTFRLSLGIVALNWVLGLGAVVLAVIEHAGLKLNLA